MKNRGFTLLEILLVVAAIAILAGIVVVSINPGKQLAATRNASRRSDVNSITNAIYQYTLDHGGSFPIGLDTSLRMLGTDSVCAMSCGAGVEGSTAQTSLGNFIDNDQSTFTGTFTNTSFTSSLLQLISSNTTGSYTSDVKNANSNATWNTFSWTPNRPIGKALPNSGVSETAYLSIANANMTNNVLLMHLNEPSGATNFTDNSNNNNNGSCTGTTCATMGVAGKFTTAANFDGVGNYIQINDSTSLNITSNQITMSAWINPINTGDYQRIISKGDGNSYYAMIVNNNFQGIYIGIKTSNGQIAWNFPFSFVQGNWYHVTVVYDGAKVGLYINGNIISSASLSGNILSTAGIKLTIGKNNTATQYYKGQIDEVAVYSRALSAAEILENYRRGATNLRFQIKSCTTPTCSDVANFVGPDNTVNSFFSESSNTTNSTPSFSLTNMTNQYFQYKAYFDTTNNIYSPELKNVTLTYGTASNNVTSGENTASTCLDLSTTLSPTYLTSLPFDPQIGTAAKTYYAVKKTTNGRINVQACNAENGEIINLTK